MSDGIPGSILLTTLLCVAVAAAPLASAQGLPLTGHPRLYVTPGDMAAFLAEEEEGRRAAMLANLRESADWCLTKTPRVEWIAPVADDPIYENLYDRFYAMMMDMAVTEHLGFAYVLTGEERYGDAARAWTLACCRAWRNDADATPDGGKAYAVSRLLKGVATGYDLVYDRLSEAERTEIRDMLAATARNYHVHYFTTPERTAPDTFYTHHAIVEFSSFGVTGLALLGEAPDAADWVELTTRMFEEKLLLKGLAADGAQTEGATFWASTMHYRLFYMDALRRVTGRDLFQDYAQYMSADLALAAVAAEKQPGWNESHQSVILEPPYGQLDYYAPILLCLAREYRRSECQYLALWDHSLGHIQQTRYITPNRKEQLLFELGGYACLWYDASVEPDVSGAPLSYAFPSVKQAYARGSWALGAPVVGVSKGNLVVHVGGSAVLVDTSLPQDEGMSCTLEEKGESARIRYGAEEAPEVEVVLERPGRVVIKRRVGEGPWSFWCHHVPGRSENRLIWGEDTVLRITKGAITDIVPDGYNPGHAVGNGRLDLINPWPKAYPMVSVEPEDGEVRVEIERL